MIDKISQNKLLRLEKKFAVKAYAVMYLATPSVLPVKEVTEHLIVSRLIQAALKCLGSLLNQIQHF